MATDDGRSAADAASGHSPKGEASISVESSAKPSVPNAVWLPCNLRVIEGLLPEAITSLIRCGGLIRSIHAETLGYLIKFEHQSFGGDLQMLFSRDVLKGEFRVCLASAIEAATAGETQSGSTEGESAVPKGCAQ